MKRQHLEAIFWLRWKLTVRGVKRGSPLGAAFTALFGVVAVFSAAVGFGLALFLGLTFGPRAEPVHWLFVWSGLAVTFLLFWAIGVMTELQRSEPFSLTKLLHFPLPLHGAFLLNYASSFLSLALALVGPTMIGLALAEVWTRGLSQLALLPLVVSFFLMVTAVTYQFRGWLATLMSNKRRRGTVLALVSLVFIVVVNAPNILRFTTERDATEPAESHYEELVSDIQNQGREGRLTASELSVEIARLQQERAEARVLRRQKEFDRRFELTKKASLVLPPGWLPYAAWAASRGHYRPALFATLGMLAIAAMSLRRAYASTLRFYRGEPSGLFAARRRRRSKAPAGRTDRARFLERRIPGCSEHVAATALVSLRGLWRSPQVKILMLTPLLVVIVLGGGLFSNRDAPLPEAVRALLALGIGGLTMLTLSQLLQNLFGYDGGGFRAFVLSAAPRSEILLGKNLSIAPFALALGLAGTLILEVVSPLRLSHALASVLQLINIYLICCMLGNLISILAPMPVSQGSRKAIKPPAGTLPKQFAFALLIPIAILPTAVPLGLEELLRFRGSGSGLPIYLLLSLVELPLVVWIYRKALVLQGRLLASREQRVLAVVGSEVE